MQMESSSTRALQGVTKSEVFLGMWEQKVGFHTGQWGAYSQQIKGVGLPFTYFTIVPKITEIVIRDKGYSSYLTLHKRIVKLLVKSIHKYIQRRVAA